MADAGTTRLASIRGRAGAVTVVLTGLTVLDGPDGPRRLPYPAFPTEFLEALRGRLVSPRRRGLLRSGIACPSCGAALHDGASQPVGVATEVWLRDLEPVQVDLAVPGIVCPRCRMQVVRVDDPQLASDLGDAVNAAFRKAEVDPG
jgi:DNA-directed RNA polymerase subunit RPC12/RpoP